MSRFALPFAIFAILLGAVNLWIGFSEMRPINIMAGTSSTVTGLILAIISSRNL